MLHNCFIIDYLEEDLMNIPKSFVAFDLETTGFSPKSNRIIEIGAVKIIDGKEIDTFQCFINPCCLIPEHIIELTCITNEMVYSANFIELMLPEFLYFAGNLPLAAHHAPFDMSFIRADADRLNIIITNGVIDTVPLARILLPQLANHKLGTLSRYLGAFNGIEHRALADARVVAEFLLWIDDQK
jgi:DNA polymerase-3 subunit alpha (Gram-positive type)